MFRRPLPLLISTVVFLCALASAPRPSAADVTSDQETANYAQGQALVIYHTFKNQDWKKLFFLVGFTPKIQAQLPASSADAWAKGVAKGIEDSGQADTVKKLCDGMHNIEAGDAVVKGTTATVPVSSTVTLNGSTFRFKGAAHLIRVGTAWRWDLTNDEDVQKAMQTRLQELLGTSEPVAAK